MHVSQAVLQLLLLPWCSLAVERCSTTLCMYTKALLPGQPAGVHARLSTPLWDSDVGCSKCTHDRCW